MIAQADFDHFELALSAALLLGAGKAELLGEFGPIVSAAMVGTGVALAADGTYRIARSDGIPQKQAFVMGVFAGATALGAPAAGRQAGKIAEVAMKVLGSAYGWNEAEIQQLTINAKTHLAVLEQQREEADSEKSSPAGIALPEQEQVVSIPAPNLLAKDAGETLPRVSNLGSKPVPNQNVRHSLKPSLSKILAIARVGSASILLKSRKAFHKAKWFRGGVPTQAETSTNERLKKFRETGAIALRHADLGKELLRHTKSASSARKTNLSARRNSPSNSVFAKTSRQINLPSVGNPQKSFMSTALKLGRQGRPVSGLGTHSHERVSGFAQHGQLKSGRKIRDNSSDPNLRPAAPIGHDRSFGTKPVSDLAKPMHIDHLQFSEMLSRELDAQARLPPSGPSGFDPRLSPAWPGLKLPN